MSRGTVLPGLLVALALAAPPASCYNGVGSEAVRGAVGRVPQGEDELDDEIEAREKAAAAGQALPTDLYALAVLRLNRPRTFELVDAREPLAEAIGSDPALDPALNLWLDLIPSEGELRAAAQRLQAGPATAGRAWALANVAWRLDQRADAERSLDECERLDPAYAGRAAWLRAVLYGEDKEDDRATRAFLAALDHLDDATAALIVDNAVGVALPEEIQGLRAMASLDRREKILSFWKSRDVFPLTESNERLGEHMRRLKRARKEFTLRGNGRAYLTTHDTFKEYSPDLDFYSSDVVYDYMERFPYWLDHRAFVYVRHGEPDRIARSNEGVRAETWLYTRNTFKPLLFHLIDRTGIGEFVLTLNLAQAMTTTAIEDDPKQVLLNSRNFLDLYSTRAYFHPLFARVAQSRSAYEIEDLLMQEAATLAAFLREAWYDDTNNLIEKDDTLPFAAYGSNFRAPDGKVDAYVYYAIPEKELKGTEPVLEFDSTLVVFSANWSKRLASTEHHFRFERKGGKKPGKEDLLVGALELKGIEPGRYNFAFQVQERKTGKVGIARGRFVTDYFGPEWVDLSDLLLAGEIKPAETASIFERRGQKIVPVPTRTFFKGNPGRIYYEIYDLKPGADGKTHYRIEYRLLKVQGEASLAAKVLGFGMNIASAFFPYPVFLARVGMFGVQVATADPDRGLDVRVEEREGPPAEVATEVITLDTQALDKGIYQAYVTVKDYVTGSLSTRDIRFAVTE